MILHKVQRVEPLSDFTLLVTFRNQEQKEYDVKPLFKKWDAFLLLEGHKELFDQVRVDAGGYGISWNDDIDLSCDELYFNGVQLPIPIPPADPNQ